MSRIAWFNVEHGAAGDMLLGALLDAGAPLERITQDLGTLDLGSWKLEVDHTLRAGVRATTLSVRHQDQTPRTWSTIDTMLRDTPWPERVIARSREVFARIATVEASIHGVRVDEVHFHEVGAIDSIVDTVGFMLALEYLDIDDLWSSPIGISSGTVQTEHGILPAVAPATAVLLQDMVVNVRHQNREIITPTAAAILSCLSRQSLDAVSIKVETTGMGAGTWNPETHPNVVQVLIGDTESDTTEMICVLETVVDDVTGEHLGHVLSELITAEALDAWASPITMKKGRPSHEITVLCTPSDLPNVEALLLKLTGSLGVRRSLQPRVIQSRRFIEISVFGHRLTLKIGPSRVKPEFEDLVAVARATGRTLYEVEAEALAIWRHQSQH